MKIIQTRTITIAYQVYKIVSDLIVVAKMIMNTIEMTVKIT